MRLMKRWQKRLRALVQGEAVDRELDEELAFHLEMETAKHVRAGLSPEAARREARLAFGAVRQHRAEARDARWLSWLPGVVMDFKLGGHMLHKYPGLTLVGGVAMAFAIWVGAITFEMVGLVVYPSLPLPGGDRVVTIRNWDAAASTAEPRALHDYIGWRESLQSVTDLGAYQDVTRNLITDDGDARPVQVAEITAAAFRIAPAPPLLGRVLVPADEAPGAAPVVLLGHDVWQSRFASAPGVIGRSVRLGDRYATVVGVMPKGFAFPVSHALWMPLRPAVVDQAPRAGPGITVFGRLAPGVTLERAQAELTLLGQRAAAEFPATHQHLQPQVAPYATQFTTMGGGDNWLMLSIPLFAVMLLVLVCSNVALLLFARAATRESELLVRSALGASRLRIIAQLFAEALVLGALAAVIGLVAADVALRQWGRSFLELNLGQLPFWYDLGLSPATVLWASGLTLLGAAIAGVLPGLKVTRGLGTRLRNGTAGGGLRFGGVWTAVIITQVAVTAAFPAVAFIEQRELRRIQSHDVGFAAEEYLAVNVGMDGAIGDGAPDDDAESDAESDAGRARFGTALDALRQQLLADARVTGVTFVDRLPLMPHPERRFELEDDLAVPVRAGGATQPVALGPLREVSITTIDPSYFEVLESPVLAGRLFNGGDTAPDARVVIVDQGFVDQVMPGRNAVGRRLRFVARGAPIGGAPSAAVVAPPEPWLEIVGVVQEHGAGSATQRGRAAGLYRPAALGRTGSLNMLVHTRGDPMVLAQRVRVLATAVDPTLRLSEFQRVDEVTSGLLWILRLWLRVTGLLTAVALLLSLAGIYAVMSFTVARRTREIGIRVALGANARRVIVSIFRRPLTQVAMGVAAGAVLAGVLVAATSSCQDGVCSEGSIVTASGVALLVLYSLLILAVCLLACVVPTRRALAVEPAEALRAE